MEIEGGLFLGAFRGGMVKGRSVCRSTGGQRTAARYARRALHGAPGGLPDAPALSRTPGRRAGLPRWWRIIALSGGPSAAWDSSRWSTARGGTVPLEAGLGAGRSMGGHSETPSLSFEGRVAGPECTRRKEDRAPGIRRANRSPPFRASGAFGTGNPAFASPCWLGDGPYL